jgi:endonuclease/exonuclease/phosphatase family metal-dependent hydrolase
MAPTRDFLPWFAFRRGSWGIARTADGAPPAALAPPRPLTLLTWNVWFARHRFKERATALLDELRWRAPDVVALQEVTPELLRLLCADPTVRASYQLSDIDGSTFQGYGVMLLSRVPLIGLWMMRLPTRMGRRLLVATLSSGLTVATVHLESTLSCAPTRADQLGLILPALRSESDDVVLVGDMNFAPDAVQENAALGPDFIDTWLRLKGDSPGYSVDGLGNPMRALDGDPIQKRIDRVFVRSTDWSAEEISLTGMVPFDSDGTFVSDHFGLEVLLRQPARSANSP